MDLEVLVEEVNAHFAKGAICEIISPCTPKQTDSLHFRSGIPINYSLGYHFHSAVASLLKMS